MNIAVLGAQWGDEGKGKIVDLLTPNFSIVARYQGGHNEYFRYMVDMLAQAGAEHIRVIVGGGGTIAPHEIDELHAYGVERIYSPEDGRQSWAC